MARHRDALTLLHLEAREGHVEVVGKVTRLLLRNGADAETQDIVCVDDLRNLQY
jgi:hypothetical protein